VANDVLLEIARTAPSNVEAVGAIKGMPRGMVERAGRDVLDAVKRGLAVPEAQLPKFPRSARWDKDPDFDAKVSKLKAVRDEAAERLQLDPGVLCSRERMETIARAMPRTTSELESIPGLRKWQIGEMGTQFVAALSGFKAAERQSGSPYRE
jgi:ribonuclease D